MTLAADYRAGWRFARTWGPWLVHPYQTTAGCRQCAAFLSGILDADRAPLDQACDPWLGGFDDPVATRGESVTAPDTAGE